MEGRTIEDFEKEPLILKIKIASKAVKICLNSNSKNIGVFDSYRPFLFALAYKDGLTQTELVKFSRLSKPTVSLTLQQMEKEGLILFKSNETDHRKTMVFLTDEGRNRHKEMRSFFDSLNQDVVNLFNNDELKELNDYLDRMIRYLLKGEDIHD